MTVVETRLVQKINKSNRYQANKPVETVVVYHADTIEEAFARMDARAERLAQNGFVMVDHWKVSRHHTGFMSNKVNNYWVTLEVKGKN